MRARPIAILALLVVVAAVLLAPRARSWRDDPSGPDATPRPAAEALRDPRFRITGVHFWQGNWNYNFWSNLRVGTLGDDLQRIRALGFNTIVLTVPWGVFQTDADPPRYDPDAYDRLALVLDEAWRAGLYTILRVGTLESVPRGIAGESFSAPYVFFDQRERGAYADLFRETSARLAGKPGLLFQFFSWEDVTAYLRIGQQGEPDRLAYARHVPGWAKHLASRPIADWNVDWGTSYAGADAVGIPPYGSRAFREFLRYADDHLLGVVLPEVAAAARRGDPDARLSYEIRIDGEPIVADGQTEYFGHEVTWPLTPDFAVVTAYFNPYWGARNEGDVISPDEALRNLATLLRGLRRAVGGKRIFFDQFNFVDSTPAFRHNSRLAGEPEIATFLTRALGLLREQSLGYALWSLDAYEANVLRNARFERGLAGWQRGEGAEGSEAAPGTGAGGDTASGASARADAASGARVQLDPATRDHFATLAPGASLAQAVRAGWNPGVATPDVPYTVRLRARSAGGGTLEVRYRADGADDASTVAQPVVPGPAWQTFAWQVPFAPAFRITLAARGDGAVDVDDVTVFNHVQEAALFDPLGRALGRRPDVVAAANREWLRGTSRALAPSARDTVGAGAASGAAANPDPAAAAAAAADADHAPAAPAGASEDGWLVGQARLPVVIPASARTIELDLYLPETPAWRDGNGVRGSLGATALGSYHVPPGGTTIVLPLPADVTRGAQVLTLDFRRTVVPADAEPGSADARPLTAMLRALRVK